MVPNREGPWLAQFFECQVKQNATACSEWVFAMVLRLINTRNVKWILQNHEGNHVLNVVVCTVTRDNNRMSMKMTLS